MSVVLNTSGVKVYKDGSEVTTIDMMKIGDADVVSALGYTPAKETDLTAHTSDGTIHLTSKERTNWNAAKAEADELNRNIVD